MGHTIQIAGISDELLSRLDANVRRHGGDRDRYVLDLIERDLEPERSMTFAEILAPVHEYTGRSGATEGEISEFVDSEIAAYRAERRAAHKERTLVNA